MSTLQKTALVVVTALTALAGALHYAGAAPVASFAVAALALAGLAWLVAVGTEEVGARLGPGATGFLQSTLGNLPEFFVVIFALGAGQLTVAQTSIIGSIFANALLVLGLVIIVGAASAEDGVMRFRRRLPNDTATLLLVSLFLIVIVGLSLSSGDAASHHIKAISIIGSICLLTVYGAWAWGYLRSDPAAGEAEPPKLSIGAALLLLTAAGAASAFVSDWFIDALAPAIDKLGISEAFAGLVIVAIAGNAVENVTGLMMARKGRSDLAISIVKNSVAQIAAFLFPALVLVSLLFTTTLTFALAPVFIGALLLTALVVWQITGDGEATVFEGVALVAVYVVLAAYTLYL